MSKLIDLTGKVFGEWTVIKRDELTNDRKVRWICRCSCGEVRSVSAVSLNSGTSRSCGHTSRKYPSIKPGDVFTYLTVIEEDDPVIERDNCKRRVWKCECKCGNIVSVRDNDLKSGNTKSCGCLKKEIQYQTHHTHGASNSRLYGVWNGVKRRCYSPNDAEYKNYGARGITICNDWLYDFSAFRDWALSNGYDENAPYGECTLDRIDSNGSYSPENCRFVDVKHQVRNRRNTLMINYKGEEKPLAELCEELDLNYKKTIYRINKGLSLEEIIDSNECVV